MSTRTKVVARLRDGSTVKGYIFDFVPSKEAFHVVDPHVEHRVTEVRSIDLKALFYVNDFEGDSKRLKSRKQAEEAAREGSGVKLKVRFEDGEVLFGTTAAFSRGRNGFFVTPSDPSCNNRRAYVRTDATTSIDVWR